MSDMYSIKYYLQHTPSCANRNNFIILSMTWCVHNFHNWGSETWSRSCAQLSYHVNHFIWKPNLLNRDQVHTHTCTGSTILNYWRQKLTLPLRIAKLSGLLDLSLDFSLLAIERSTQVFASEIQAVRRLEGRSKEAASAHKPSCTYRISSICQYLCASSP